MKKSFLVYLGVIALLGGCMTDNVDEPIGEIEEIEEQEEVVKNEESKEPTEIEEALDPKLTVLAENLTIPWSITKTDEIFYLSERVGTIAKIENGEVTHQVVQLEHEVSTEAEAGLLGFVLDPDFVENQSAFAYYTYEGENGPTNRIVRLLLTENEWEEVAVLLDAIPSGSYHHGGRLAIGADEKLYATTGDALNPEFSQDLNSLAGKILRMNLDGSIPSENPYEESYVYSYGHRNAQGLVWTADGKMYASEHGNQANDEVNEIIAGKNYGWPIIEGEEERSDMQTPIFTSGAQETWAPSGMAEQDGKLYVAALRGNAVLVFNPMIGEMKTHLTEYGRIRDIHIEDGYLYFITNNRDGRGNPSDSDDQLLRIGLTELE